MNSDQEQAALAGRSDSAPQDGLASMKQGDYQQAASNSSKAVRLDSEAYEAYAHRGDGADRAAR